MSKQQHIFLHKHQWVEGVVENLNPDFTFKLTKNMLHGDPHCEWIVERNKQKRVTKSQLET